MSDLNTEELNPAASKTPLEQVKEQQAIREESRQQFQQSDSTPEVPGAGPPSDKRHHPQRQIYEGGNASSETI
ncbi:hypothetical protein EON80_13890 [bacterium]|nr:MAG: hypothetical protein EON80_13890 [bacterium]